MNYKNYLVSYDAHWIYIVCLMTKDVVAKLERASTTTHQTICQAFDFIDEQLAPEALIEHAPPGPDCAYCGERLRPKYERYPKQNANGSRFGFDAGIASRVVRVGEYGYDGYFCSRSCGYHYGLDHVGGVRYDEQQVDDYLEAIANQTERVT